MRNLHSLGLALVVVAGATVRAAPAKAAPAAVAACLESSEGGQTAIREGRYRAARTQFVRCAADVCPSVVRRDCIASLADLDRLEPTVVFAVRDERGVDMSDVAVALDGERLLEHVDGRPVTIDAGSHVLSFTASGYGEERLPVVARAGEKNRLLSVQLRRASAPVAATKPAPTPEPPTSTRSEGVPVLPIVLAAVGVAAIGAFAGLGISGRSALDELEHDPCATTRTCSASTVDSIHTRFTIADISLGVGIVALGAAAVLWFVRDRAASAATP